MNKATLLQYKFCYWLSLKGFTNKKCWFRNCFEKSPNKNPIAWYLNNLPVFRCSFRFSKKWNNSKKLHIFCAISEMKRAIQDPLVAKRQKFCYSFRLWLFWKINWVHAASVTMHALIQVLWRHIWKCTVNKVQQMQPIQLPILLVRQFEDSFENTQRRKAKQMQPMWLCMLWPKYFEDTFKNTYWRKVLQVQPV